MAQDLTMKKYRVLIERTGKKDPTEVPVFAESFETAHDAAELEYGEGSVIRVRPDFPQEV